MVNFELLALINRSDSSSFSISTASSAFSFDPIDVEYMTTFLPPEVIDENPSVDCHVFVRLSDAIKTHPDGDGKRAYLRALSIAPKLILLESNPLLFLQRHDFEPKRAANRLLKYWRTRYVLFGDDAYKPMTFFNGALNEEDRKHVDSGHVVISNHRSRMESKPMIAISDMSRINTSCLKTRLRALFYCHQVMSLWPRICEKGHGFILVVVFTKPKLDMGSFENAHMWKTCSPCRCLRVHFVDVASERTVFQAGFVSGIKKLYGSFFRDHAGLETHIHKARPVNEIIEMLCGRGFQRDELPTTIGGTWEYSQQCPELLRVTQNREKEVYANFPSFSGHPSPMWATMESDGDDSEEREAISNLEVGLGQLSVDDQHRYCKAREVARERTWDQECSLMAFIALEEGDHPLAAKRIVRYWKLRAAVFKNRQYDPLVQTRGCALSRRDLNALRTGFLCPLPKDSEGRPVLWIDESKLERWNKNTARNRCIFYMCSVLSEDEGAQTKGVVILYKRTRLSRESLMVNLEFLEDIANSLAIRFHSVHQIFRDSFTVSGTKRISGLVGAQWYSHTGPNYDAIAQELVDKHGLSRNGLPAFLGGQWNVAKFARWCELRERAERGIPLRAMDEATQEQLSEFPALPKSSFLGSLDEDAGHDRKRPAEET